MSDSFWTHEAGPVFVTGATGLVGSWLVRALVERRARVVVLVRDHDPQSELVRSGLIDSVVVVNGALECAATMERAIVEHEVQTVFHLGAQTIVGAGLRSPRLTFEANIQGTWNLLEACRLNADRVQRVLVASSDKAYGEAETLPYTESTPPLGRHPYDVSKSCTDLIAQAYHHTYDLPVVIARCGNIYGGGDLNWSRIVPGTIRSYYNNEPPIIRSDGTFLRDYVYVRDAVGAYMVLAEQAARPEVRGGTFNFGPGEPQSVLEIVDVIQRLMRKQHIKPDIQNTARAEIKNQYLDSTKARDVLNWRPQWSLEEGLRETIDWYIPFLDRHANPA
ncbi:MAG: GDP-mannose 4,6-dehydratase [Planctomycetota bacterium]